MAQDALEETQTLIRLANTGDQAAADRLFARYSPALLRWARGRLPHWARDIADTHDIVQDALMQTFRNLDGFEYRGEGALHHYLRTAVRNGIREEVRRRRRRGEHETLDPAMEDDAPSPLEAAIGRESFDRYDNGLEQVSAEERELIIGRFELGLSYREIADALGKPSEDAARMAVARALVRLVKLMGTNGR
jgi:RNA polymerase sigma-70 factor (ECF subfamily)